jgi:hypothetical protein
MIRFTFLLWSLFVVTSLVAQKHTISGHVYDQSGESLVGANVIVKDLKIGTVTNSYGFYSLTLPEGTYTLLISYIGYGEETMQINLSKDYKFEFNLEESQAMIESVIITSERRDVNVKQVEMSSERLDIKTIERIPTFMGEADVIKTIQLQPGVSTVGEGTSGFYVRGGAVDQNLILLDEAIVYNPAHFGGFFSVFNPDVVKSVELYKGGMPAKFGGRQASVLDVNMREGNADRFSAKGGVGTLSTRLTIEAPIVKDKASFLLSGRRTYYDYLFFPLINEPIIQDSKVFFWDLNAKVNYKINDNNRLYLSLYSGEDVVAIGSLFQMGYGNATGTLRWNHVFNDRLFSNFMLVGSRYDYSLGQPAGSGYGFDWTSQINDYSFKNDYTYFLNPNNTIDFGVQIIYHKLKPGKFEPLEVGPFTSIEVPREYSYESAIYLGNEQQITSLLSMQYGLRFSLFNNAGGVENEYDEDYEFVAQTEHAQGKVTNTYYGLEPRIGARYIISEKSSVKVSYNRMFQYIHLATNSQAPTPFDIWFTSNTNVKPQLTDQVAVGYFRNFFDNKVEASLEVYYKWLDNAIDFKDHAELLGNDQLDGEVRQGIGYAYGMEFYLRKQYGKFTGWLSYTWSYTRREIEGINSNKPYPTSYDRPNDIKIVLSYEFTPRLNASANWVYYTAMPFTVPVSYGRYQNAYLPDMSERNSYRYPNTDYHRLDLSLTWNFYKPTSTSRYKSSLTASVYNAYNRHNLYTPINVDDPSSVLGIGTNKMFLFKVIPAVTYNFTF